VVFANDKLVIELRLSGGECHDAPEGRKPLATIGGGFPGAPVLTDKASYEGDETRKAAQRI
jgi:hypothetical protein